MNASGGLRWDVQFLPDGRLACLSEEGMRIVDALSGKRISEVEFKPPSLFAGKTLLFRGNRLFVRRESGIAAFDVERGEFDCNIGSSAYHQFLPLLKSNLLCAGGVGGDVDLINVDTGKIIRHLKGHSASVSCLAIAADENRLLSVGDEDDVRLWDIGVAESSPSAYHLTGDEVASVDYKNATGLRFSSSGRRLFSAQYGAIHIWTVPGLTESNRVLTADGQGGVQFLSDHEAFGSFLVQTKKVDVLSVLYSLKSGKAKKSIECPVDYVGPAAINPINRSKTVVAVTTGREFISLLSFPKGEILQKIEAHPHVEDGVNRRINGLAFSPDETTVLSSSGDNTLKEWDIATGKLRRRLKGRGKSIEGFELSTDGTVLAICEDRAIKILDATTWKVLRRINRQKHVHWPSMSFSPDNELLAAATTHDKEMTVFRVGTGKAIATLRGHTAGITHVCFSPKGDYLATASDDSTLKLWGYP